jgi:hypothetical protein
MVVHNFATATKPSRRLRGGVVVGISVSVVMATDAEIDVFSKSPSGLEALLDRLIPSICADKCYLADHWDWLHVLLTGQRYTAELPLGAIKSGDVMFTGLTDHAHAIYSATAKALLAELQKLSESTLWARLRQQAGPGAGSIYPGRYWRVRPSDEDRGEFIDLMHYFERLRDFAGEAVRQNKGLIFCCYEDW